ncbi:protein GVQW3 [Trichonephila clavipes]|nr:protein GVQW3 [Trichonephila clavipes]
MCENTDQRICIKFCFELGKTGPETYEMMKTAFGDESCSVFDWFRRFKEGRQSVNSDPRSGRPSTSRNEDKIAQVKAVVCSDRHLKFREIAQESHISVGSCAEILRMDLNMRRVSEKFAPRLLTEDQKFQRLATSSDLFQSASDDTEFMKLILTGDELWVYGYDPETKQQSSQWKTPGVHLGQRKHDQSHVDCVFHADGIVHHEYDPQGQTVNKEFYLDVMRRLREAVRRKRPVLRASSRWMVCYCQWSIFRRRMTQNLFKYGAYSAPAEVKTAVKSDISENLIKTLWLEKLPEANKNILVINDKNLGKLVETDLKGMWGCLRSTDSMAGEAVSLHSLLPNRNCKIYRQNFEADDFPCGAVNLYKGWRANSRGFLLLLRLPEKPSTAGKRTCYPRSTPSVALSLFQS